MSVVPVTVEEAWTAGWYAGRLGMRLELLQPGQVQVRRDNRCFNLACDQAVPKDEFHVWAPPRGLPQNFCSTECVAAGKTQWADILGWWARHEEWPLLLPTDVAFAYVERDVTS